MNNTTLLTKLIEKGIKFPTLRKFVSLNSDGKTVEQLDAFAKPLVDKNGRVELKRLISSTAGNDKLYNLVNAYKFLLQEYNMLKQLA